MFDAKTLQMWPKVFKILVAGGCGKANEGDVLDSCEMVKFSVSSESSIPKYLLMSERFASLNEPRRGACLVSRVADNRNTLLIIGGCSVDKRQSNSMEIYDDEAQRWRLIENVLSRGRSCFVTSSQGEKPDSADVFYVAGGWDGGECVCTVDRVEVQKFNAHVTSQPCANLISPLKNSFCLDLPNKSKSLLIGGWDGQRTLDTVFAYDSASSEPQRFISRLPFPVECHSCAVWRDRKILVVGGFDGLAVRGDIVVIDADTLQATVSETKLRHVRECLCIQVVDDYLIVAGGWDGYQALRSVEVFKLSEGINSTLAIEPLIYDESLLLEARNRACSIVYQL